MSLKALLIDDDPDMRRIFGPWFERRGAELAVCESAGGAVAAARAARPDVILLDVFLGDDDGFSVCGRLKADPSLKGIPVIMLSGLGLEAGYKVKGLESGADDYIVKEFNEDLLFVQIEAALRRRLSPEELKRMDGVFAPRRTDVEGRRPA